MEIIKILLIAVFIIQVNMIYLLIKLLRPLKKFDQEEHEYQKEQAASLAEYKKCVEKWRASIDRYQEYDKKREKQWEEYQRDAEEDTKKRRAAWAEYEKGNEEWQEELDRFKALLDKWEKKPLSKSRKSPKTSKKNK